jgi:hypothetical protein
VKDRLRAIDGGADQVADVEAANGKGHEDDALQRLQQARKTPKAATDDTGQALKKLSAANELAGLKGKRGKRIIGAIERGEGNAAVIDLEFENGARVSATVRQLFDPRHMDGAITQATKVAPEYHTPKEWRPFPIAVLQASTPDNATDDEATETGEWISSFAHECTTHELLAHAPGSAVPLDDPAKLFDVLKSDDGAFRGSDGCVYLRVPQLLEHVTGLLRQRVTSTELRQRLGRLGFTKPRNSQGQLAARKGEETITRRYLASAPEWELP